MHNTSSTGVLRTLQKASRGMFTRGAICECSRSIHYTVPRPQISLRPPRRSIQGVRVRRFSTSPLWQSQGTKDTISYAIAASYSSKKDKFTPANTYNHDPFIRQKPGRREKRSRPRSGEDSFFVSSVNTTGNTAFGVVDGVGGWTTSGVDPADFAHGLCEYMTTAAMAWPRWEDVPDNSGIKVAGATDFEGLDPLRPVELLQEGYDRVLKDKSVFAGGSTACVVIAAPTGRVEAANLGDSGLLHLSPHRITSVTSPQTHAFNTPYQLSKLPAQLLLQQAIFGGGKPYSEVPTNADISTHQISPGDVLVLATDGVWDNLSAQDILSIIDKEMTQAQAWGSEREGGPAVSSKIREMTQRNDKGESQPLQARLAIAVTKAAKEAALSRTRDGPFAREVQRLYPQENWRGGKLDDICVVVAIAVSGGNP